jgi:uncharacterized membrane protein
MRFAITIAARRRRRTPALLILLAALAVAAAFAACSSGDKTLDAVDPQAVTADPTYDQVFAIVHNKCVSCHDSGAEEISALTTCTDIVALRGDILDRIQDNTMPPGVLPRLSSEDKLLIQRWVENGAPAPCN